MILALDFRDSGSLVLETAEQALTLLQAQPIALGLLILMLSAFVEYIFPPFPGDSVTIVGALMIAVAGWPWAAVFGAVMIGAMAGAMVAWGVGVWVERCPDDANWLQRFLAKKKIASRIDEIKRHFDDKGAYYLVFSRFLPAFRSLFFVAAGMAGMSARSVAFWATISAGAWNAFLMGVGWWVGFNLEAIVGFVDRYTTVVLIAVGIALLGAWYVRRRRAKASEESRQDG